MEKEIKELAELFMGETCLNFNDCYKFARIAIREGYKNKKCFNVDHVVYGKEFKK